MYMEVKEYTIGPNMMFDDPSIKDSMKYRAFHKDMDHTTKKCKALKFKVANVLKCSYLRDFLGKPYPPIQLRKSKLNKSIGQVESP